MNEKNTATTVAPAAKTGKLDTSKVLIVRPAAQPVPTPEPEKPKAETPAQAEEKKPAFSPIADRLERFALLEKYVGQLELVQEALDELQDFKPDPSGGDQIIIKEADGSTHSTRHPVAVAAMVAAAVEKLKEKKTELESFIVL